MTTQISELEIVEFDADADIPDDGHAYCPICYPDTPAGSIVIAHCGVLYRARNVWIKNRKSQLSCELCISAKTCRKCGVEFL